MIEHPSKSATDDQRVIRVFVSLTFRDMPAERVDLAKVELFKIYNSSKFTLLEKSYAK